MRTYVVRRKHGMSVTRGVSSREVRAELVVVARTTDRADAPGGMIIKRPVLRLFGPGNFSREAWEKLKQVGDAAWAEWGRQAPQGTIEPQAVAPAVEARVGIEESPLLVHPGEASKTVLVLGGAAAGALRGAVLLSEDEREYLEEELREYREHERERLERAANPPPAPVSPPKEVPAPAPKFVVWYRGLDDAGAIVEKICEAATGPVIYTTEEAALASIAAVWSKLEKYGATKLNATNVIGVSDPVPNSQPALAPAPLDHFVVRPYVKPPSRIA